VAAQDDNVSELRNFLEGVRVLDLSSYVPGPLASLLLSDMGARVVKVERPAGDEYRQFGPRGKSGDSVYYEAANADKVVVRLDLRNSDDLASFRELVASADVVIEGFRPGVALKLGIDYESLRRINTALIYCSMSGYGANGPLKDAAGHDGNYLSSSGLLHRNGTPPVVYDNSVSDGAGSMFAALTIAGALYRRVRSGRGCHIDLGLADAVMPLQFMHIAAFGATGDPGGPGQSFLNGAAAYYNVYPTHDRRHVMLGALEQKFWRAFCEAAGRPDWIARQSDPLPQHALKSEVAALFASMDLAACVARFADADCCLTAILDLNEAVNSRQIVVRKLVRRAEDGALQALYPVHVDGLPPPSRRPVRELSASAAKGFLASD
jgi:crotonobetainyl-CoA:carnitine CoA-transferase CaiB-like acyl-CoA transferase